jgi:putative ABC transport system permease protein
VRLAAAAVAVFAASSLLLFGATPDGDVTELSRYGHAVLDGQLPYRDFALEYPPGAIPLFTLPATGHFVTLFRLENALGWAIVLVLVALLLPYRTPDRLRNRLLLGAVALTPLALGPFALMRFDAWAAALALGALLALLRRRPTLGLALLALGTLIVLDKPSSAAVGIAGLVVLTAAMLLLLPVLLQLLVMALDVATRAMRSIVPFLAITDLRDPATRLRSLAVAATGAIAVFGSVALQGAHADLQRGLDRTAHDLASIGDVWAVAPGPANLLATTSFPAPPVRTPAGLASITAYRGSFLDIGSRRIWVFGSPVTAPRPFPRGQMLDGNTARSTRLLRRGGWAVVSQALGRQLHLHAGDRFLLPSPVPLTVRVSALSTNMGWPPGAIVINADDYARAWGSDDVSALNATLAAGTSPAEGRRLLREALGPHTGLVVKTAADRQRALNAGSRQGLARLTQIAAMVLVAAMIAMAAAMAGMIWQRRAFLASMKVEGYTTAELWRSLLLEAAVLVGAGCVIGAAFGLLGQSLLSRALTTVTGFPVDYSTAALGALLTCIAVTVVAVAIIAVFGHRAARIAAESGLR